MSSIPGDLSPLAAQGPVEYHGQYGQDRFVDQLIFRGKRGGVFVDIGAHDGRTFSNTYALERARGWTGLCVEPIPARFAECRSARTATCVEGCVAPETGKRSFTIVEQADMLSGLGDYFSSEHRERVLHGEGKGGNAAEISVDCHRFGDLMERQGIERIDYCSIDTEGSELEILRSVDFSRYRPTCFTVEHNGHRLALWSLLSRHGYRLVEQLGADLVFVTREHARTMGDVGFLDGWELPRRLASATVRRAGQISLRALAVLRGRR